MLKQIKTFIKAEDGATIIEYALLAALIGVLLIAALNALRGGISGTFSNVTANLN